MMSVNLRDATALRPVAGCLRGCLIAEVSAPGVSVTVSSVFIGAVATGKRQGVDPL